jgi:hypothetical protein
MSNAGAAAFGLQDRSWVRPGAIRRVFQVHPTLHPVTVPTNAP